MAYFEFPNTRTYDGDLGYVVKKVTELTEKYNTFFAYNTIHFADPIAWDITSQYAPFTIVFDFDNQSSYISRQPVPAGINIDNVDYWSFVGPLIVDGEARTEIDRILHFITNVYESGATASGYIPIGTYLIVNKDLVKATRNINTSEALTIGYNIEQVTIETMIDEIFDSKIPAVYTYIDDAINIIDGQITSIQSDIGTLTTGLATANDRITSVNQGLTLEINNRTAADNALGARIDNLAHLTDGSTTGDAELIDGRVGGDGITYSSIGNAIRAQYANFDNYLTYYLKTEFDVMSDKTCAYLGAEPDGTLQPRPGTLKDIRFNVNKIPTNGKKFVHLQINAGYMVSLLQYQADNTFLGSSGWKTSSMWIQLDPTCAYINIGCTKTPYSTAVVITDDEAKMNIKTDVCDSVGGDTFQRATVNYLTPNNFSGVLSDLNDAYENVIYVFHAMNVTTLHPLNYPDRYTGYEHSSRSVLRTFTTPDGLKLQEFIASHIHAIRACFNGVWENWDYIEADPFTVYASKATSGYNIYSSFKDACDAAYTQKGSRLIVLDGTYDLVSEFGQTYLDNLASSPLEASGFGCKVGNGMHIEFRNGSKLVFNYTGTNDVTQKLFSPLHVMSTAPEVSIENAIIEANNCRYCIHAEAGTYANFYKVSIKNCTLTHDNSDGATNVNCYTYACIGCGIGVQASYEIRDNKCVSVPYVNGNIDYSHPDTAAQEVIFTHTSGAGTKQLTQIFSGNYVDGGTIIARGYNDIEPTLCMVSNNRVNYTPQLETVGGGLSNLIDFNEFNNQVDSY